MSLISELMLLMEQVARGMEALAYLHGNGIPVISDEI